MKIRLMVLKSMPMSNESLFRKCLAKRIQIVESKIQNFSELLSVFLIGRLTDMFDRKNISDYVLHMSSGVMD